MSQAENVTLTANSVTQPPGLFLVGTICYNTAHCNPFARRNMSNPNDKFTWIPVYKAIAEKLLEYRNRQPELIEILQEIHDKVVPIWEIGPGKIMTTVQDKVDPFSFFSVFNKGSGKSEEKSKKIIQTILSRFELDKETPPIMPPSDFDGILPIGSQYGTFNTWEKYKTIVQEKDIEHLWDIADDVINKEHLSISLFTQCDDIIGIDWVFLTTGFYWFRPDRFIVMSGKIYKFLEDHKIDRPNSINEYGTFLQNIRGAFKNRHFADDRFYAEVTYEAIHNTSSIQTGTTNSTSQADEHNEPIITAIEQILKYKRQVILYGPPGTGKTHWANEAAKHFTNNEEHRVVTCTFHPEYGYEHFIEGFKPKVINEQMVFKLDDGIFKKLCDKAREDKSNEYYLIIDEINRGDIPRIFGELITLIEKDKRGKLLVTLPHSGEKFTVPDNVCIIATMNTADRSIALLDIALRRRFGFLEFMPKPELVPEIVLNNNNLRKWFEELNKLLVKNLGQKIFEAENKQIGHSYFMKKDNEPPVDVSFVLEYEIQPLIEEYCYEMKEIPLEIRKHFEKLLPPKKERWELPKEKNSQETNASQTVAEPQS